MSFDEWATANLRPADVDHWRVGKQAWEAAEAEQQQRMERLESDVIAFQKMLGRLEVSLTELTRYVSRTEYNRVNRLSQRVKKLEKKGNRK